MTETDDYLDRLDVALREVPHGVASEIRDGIAEELRALDASAAAARIAQLGDPAEIAREALGEWVPGAASVSVEPRPASATRGFAITAALVLGFGGIVVPLLGWLVGVALVSMSALWKRWEKLVASLAPIAVIVVVALVSLPAYAVSGGTQVTEVSPGMPADGSSGFDAPSVTEFDAANPLLPTFYDMTWATIALPFLLIVPLSGLWLLWRLRGRGIR